MCNSNEIIKKVEKKLLCSNGLDLDHVNNFLTSLNSTNIDFGDLYFESSVNESWSIDDSKVKNGSFNIDQGVGVRGVFQDKTALAYSDDINPRSIKEAVRAARTVAKDKKQGTVNLNKNNDYNIINNELFSPIESLSREAKVKMLYEIDSFARSLDCRVKQVIANLAATDHQFLVANTEGYVAAEIKPSVILSCTVLVEENGVREKGHSASGKAADLNFFLEEVPVLPTDYICGITDISNVHQTEKRYLAVARDAVREALVNLKAKPVQAGKFPVVLSAGWPAVLIHEAVGHGLEADAIRKGSSIFADKLGKKVASSICTIVDDGTVLNGTGSFNVDSEGTIAQKNVLIEDGILQGYMYDKQNANLMGKKSTGNGRRMSYQCQPLPRMTNTYLLPGKSNKNDIISSVDKGIYAVNFNGGQVDTASGKFTFSASEAYMIENGKVTHPLKGATLIGSGVEVMEQISMVGDNLEFDKGVGSCGKAGQSVPVGIGQPTVKIESITIGGTK